MGVQRTASLIVLSAFALTAHAFAQDRPKAHPITLSADDVYELIHFDVHLNSLQLKSDHVTAVPIRTEIGITGAMILGTGQFRYAPEKGKELRGSFRGAMLRFNPEDQQKLVPIDAAKAKTDKAAHEMSRHLLNDLFRHCWHIGMDAWIPEKGTLAANVYSKEHGDLLISTGEKSTFVYNFTEREQHFGAE